VYVRSTIKRDELYTPYLLSAEENLVYTICTHVGRGCFSMYMFGITRGDILKQVVHGTQHAISITTMI